MFACIVPEAVTACTAKVQVRIRINAFRITDDLAILTGFALTFDTNLVFGTDIFTAPDPAIDTGRRFRIADLRRKTNRIAALLYVFAGICGCITFLWRDADRVSADFPVHTSVGDRITIL